ncbi:MAG: hydrogenase maturation nickel metallochaperone HypA [Proteobacteria bacterium]|nr:hydrogenase maturation nickel metallochaperone HypA [Pseudomonadota bacterium]MCL2307923.1 hydrogenase maturation nickel metallochaperone HypA [Pseudomonadota bacterium]
MHEMSLAESMLEIVESTARKNNAQRVTSVQFELGALSHADRGALAFAFDVVTRGTLAEGARFEVIEVPGAAWCMLCSKTVALAKLGDACPECGRYQLTVTQGDAMRIASIEVI